MIAILESIGETVRCKIELKRGYDYVIEQYSQGEFGHVSYDFIMEKGKGIENNKEMALTRLGPVNDDFTIILNTKSALLDMTTYSYPICETDEQIARSKKTRNGLKIVETTPTEKALNVQPGACLIA